MPAHHGVALYVGLYPCEHSEAAAFAGALRMTGAPFSGLHATTALLHGVLAVGVTVHVLLHRREASSSIAWIALAWLAPLTGALLYLLLGINRVRRLATTLRGSALVRPCRGSSNPPVRHDALEPLNLAGQRITGRGIAPGNAIQVLQNGDEAYPGMLAAIETAQRSVGLATYLFRDDSTGRAFIDALSRASARGVAVRVLIDGIGGGYFRSCAYRRLRRAGVPTARFMHSPLPWRMPFLNLRNHSKLLCVDGQTAFIGGLNIGAENIVHSEPPRPVIDTHFRVQGPVVAQLVEVFLDDWCFSTGESLAGQPWYPALAAYGDSAARVVTSGPDQDIGKLEYLILEAVGCARNSVRIMTPYFLPDERVITTLALAAIRGVQVDLILPQHSNHRVLDWAARAHLSPLIAAGCRVWTHPPPFDHSKLMTVDGSWCLIGSANWDARSFRLNFETDLEVQDFELASRLDALMLGRQRELICASRLDARRLPEVLRDSAARLLLPYI